MATMISKVAYNVNCNNYEENYQLFQHDSGCNESMHVTLHHTI